MTNININNIIIDETINNEYGFSYELLNKKFSGNKSAMMRHLESLNFSRADISRMMNVRYQQVRNTLNRELKKN